MPKTKKVEQNLDWLKSELNNYGIDTENTIGETENSIIFYLETNVGYHLAINATINENWILVSTFRMLLNDRKDNLIQYLKYTSRLKYCKLMILPDHSDGELKGDFLDLGFEIYLENYDSNHFYLMLDCLFIGVDNIIEYALTDKIVEISTDPLSNNKTLFLSK
jgi:hypothetical protein